MTTPPVPAEATDAAHEAAAPRILAAARKGDPYIVGLRDGAADLRARVAELEQLAADILATFSEQDPAGGEGKWTLAQTVDDNRINRWKATLEGTR
jgi:hypothetical protein